MTNRQTKAFEMCEKFPDTPTMTLARKLYSENKKLYKNLEDARSAIRYMRGQMGAYLRNFAKLPKSLTHNSNPFNLPESHADPYEAYTISQSKVLIISDLHIPYQDNEAITTALKFGLEKQVNCILINGDLMDFHNHSRFERDPKARNTLQEFEATRQFLTSLRKAFPKAKIVFKIGNHDERWEKWMYIKAPELFDMTEFRLEVLLKLGELGIDIVKDKRIVKIGKLNILHGHELQGGGGVNPARATFLKTIDNVLIGHCHRSSQHTEPTMSGDVIVTTSIGCLCGMYPDFARINKWNHGFGYVEHDIKSGEYILENLKIIKGKVY
jgi:predicted phosphodiesterase